MTTELDDQLATRFGQRPASPQIAAAGAGTAQTVVAADLQGHFVVHPALDGRRIRMLVDTGASLVVLTHEDARLAGISVSPRDFTRRMSTANGIVEAAPVRIREMRVGEIAVPNVEAVVLPAGRLRTSLLGMTFLRRLGGFEISQGRLTLRGS